jgi:hypothetical protein
MRLNATMIFDGNACLHDSRSSTALPNLESTTVDCPIAFPLSATSTSPSANASSDTECRGQVVRQTFMIPAYVRGRSEIQLSNSSVSGPPDPGIECSYFIAMPCGRAGPVLKAVLKSSWNLESSTKLVSFTFATWIL